MTTATKVDQRAEGVTMVPIGQVKASADNPRKHFDEAGLAELAKSIQELGILEPLIVTPDGEGYALVAGERRLRAALQLGLAHVPCLIRQMTPQQAAIARLVENIQRADLDPLEEANGYQQLVALGISQREVADKVGRSQAHVSKRLSLLQLPKAALDLVGEKNGLTIGDALELTPYVEDPEVIDAVIAAFARVRKDTWQRQNFRAGSMAQRAKESLELQRKVDAAKQQFERTGVRALKTDQYGSVPYGALFSLGRGYGEIPMKLDEHRKLPCHAGYVDSRGVIREGCTRPADHRESANQAVAKAAKHLVREGGSSGGDRAEDSKKKAAATRARNKELRARQPIRAEALKGVLTARQRRDEILEFTLRQLLQTAIDHASGPADRAAELLEAQVPDGRSWGAWLSGGNDRLLQLAYAMALALGEHPLAELPKRGYFEAELQTHAARYFEHLQAHGYRPEKVERDQVKKPANSYGWHAAFDKGWASTDERPEGALIDTLDVDAILEAGEPAELEGSSPESKASEGAGDVLGVSVPSMAAAIVPDSSASANDRHAVCSECQRRRPSGQPDAPGWHHKTCSLRPKEAVPA